MLFSERRVTQKHKRQIQDEYIKLPNMRNKGDSHQTVHFLQYLSLLCQNKCIRVKEEFNLKLILRFTQEKLTKGPQCEIYP